VSTRARLALAATVALASAVGIGIIVAGWVGRDATGALPRGLRATAASAPFPGYREVRIRVGRTCARVVVADTDARRARGLRGTADLGPYAGMLFVLPADGHVAFTMAGVATPLAITWYATNGSRVDTAALHPCPRLGAAQCPVYLSRRAYRYALEVPAGGSAPAHLGPCSS